MPDQPRINLPDLCKLHQSLLVQQAGFGPDDPWRALLVVTNVVLFQGATCDPKVHEESGGDITKVAALGCMACRKPDLFGEVVEAAKSHDIGQVKALGDKWIAASQHKAVP